MSYELLRYHVEDRVAVIAYDRQERRNAWSLAMVREVMAAVRQANCGPPGANARAVPANPCQRLRFGSRNRERPAKSFRCRSNSSRDQIVVAGSFG